MVLGDSESTIFTDYQHSNERNFPFYHFIDFISSEQQDPLPLPTPNMESVSRREHCLTYTHTSENLTQKCVGKVTLGLDTVEVKKSSGDTAEAKDRLERAERRLGGEKGEDVDTGN